MALLIGVMGGWSPTSTPPLDEGREEEGREEIRQWTVMAKEGHLPRWLHTSFQDGGGMLPELRVPGQTGEDGVEVKIFWVACGLCARVTDIPLEEGGRGRKEDRPGERQKGEREVIREQGRREGGG